LAEELVIDDLANLDSNMTKKSVLMKLQENYQVYIFIGHGAANQEYPERSYIELAVKTSGLSASARIIHLTLEDLNQINWLGAEMVMLMGCETAGGRLYRGTGIYGLYQGFLSLGAQNVVGSLWKVAATQTLTQAESFLSAWSTHASPAQALHFSQCQMIKDLTTSEYYQHPHPYFWGSLILFSTKPITLI
jgi:CHAT domain-containing protein